MTENRNLTVVGQEASILTSVPEDQRFRFHSLRKFQNLVVEISMMCPAQEFSLSSNKFLAKMPRQYNEIVWFCIPRGLL